MIEALVEQIEGRFSELEGQIVDPVVINDRQRYADVGREYRRMQEAAKLAAEWRRAVDDAEGAKEMLAEGEDPEIREMLDTARGRITELEEEIRVSMVDPADRYLWHA